MRWGNFFQRKAAPMAPIALVSPEVAQDPLEQLQTPATLLPSSSASMES